MVDLLFSLFVTALVITGVVAGSLLLWRWLEDRREAERTQLRAFEKWAAGAKSEAPHHDGGEH